MKPNELRVGNRVLCNEMEIEITGIVENSQRSRIYDEHNNDWSLSRIEPIPITEELLLKCGFEKGEAGNFSLQWCKGFHKHKTIEIELDGGEVCSSFWIGAGADKMLLEIHSIHQLQNLFYAITGEELEINL